jgi:hypothetical protein
LPARKHDLTTAIDRIEENIRSGSGNSGRRVSSVTHCDTPDIKHTRMYACTVNGRSKSGAHAMKA